jgi:hypothetical protein
VDPDVCLGAERVREEVGGEFACQRAADLDGVGVESCLFLFDDVSDVDGRGNSLLDVFQ